jgi:hypothetical protein
MFFFERASRLRTAGSGMLRRRRGERKSADLKSRKQPEFVHRRLRGPTGSSFAGRRDRQGAEPVQFIQGFSLGLFQRGHESSS